MSKILHGIRSASSNEPLNQSENSFHDTLGLYAFNSATSTTVYDTSGFYRHGTIVNTVVQDPINTGVNGVSRYNVMDFTSNLSVMESYIDISSYGSVYNSYGGAFAVSLWLKYTTTNGGRVFIIQRNNDTTDALGISLGSGSPSIPFFTLTRNTVATLFAFPSVSSPDMKDNNWHHLVCQFTSSSNAMYIDGVQVSLTYIEGNSGTGYDLSDFAITDILIGDNYQYYLDNVYLFNKVLSADEIAQLYAENSNGNIVNNYLTDILTTDFVQSKSIYTNSINFNPTGLSAVTSILQSDDSTIDLITNSTTQMTIGTEILPSFPIYASTGDVTSPSYSFLDDTDTGITANGANELVFASTGIQIIRMDGSVGTTFNPISTNNQIALTTPSGDTGIVFNRDSLGNRTRFNIQNLSNPTTTTRSMLFDFQGQNDIRMFYLGTLWLKGSANDLAPSNETDGLGGNGTRLVLSPGTGSELPYGMGIQGGTMWYSVPSTGSHAFYQNNLLLCETSADEFRVNIVGDTNRDIVFSGGTATSITYNTAGGSNYSPFTIANHPNATATERFLSMGFSPTGINHSIRVYNDNKVTPGITNTVDLGAPSLRFADVNLGGVLTLSNPVVAIFYNRTSGLQGIPNNTYTLLYVPSIYTTPSPNQNNPTISGNNVITIVETGIYHVSYSFVYAANAQTGFRESHIYLNNSTQLAYDDIVKTSDNEGVCLSGSIGLSLAQNDVLSLRTRQNSGVQVNVTHGSTDATILSIVKLY